MSAFAFDHNRDEKRTCIVDKGLVLANWNARTA
jgi:hypothetical protein